jgi:hypothetical protein
VYGAVLVGSVARAARPRTKRTLVSLTRRDKCTALGVVLTLEKDETIRESLNRAAMLSVLGKLGPCTARWMKKLKNQPEKTISGDTDE